MLSSWVQNNIQLIKDMVLVLLLLLLLLLPFNSLFSRTTWVNQYQKGRTILDFTEARNDMVAVATAEPYAKHLQCKFCTLHGISL